MTRLYLIRHGETDWNVTGRYQGQSDPPLNQRGEEQADTLAGKLAGEPIDILYSSPLLRAAQTAQIIANRIGTPIRFDSRLMEIHQGEWQGRLRSEIESLYPDLFRRWEQEPWEVAPPKGERLVEVQQRVYAAVYDILRLHPLEGVGIVSHRIPIGLIKLRYQDLDRDILRSLQLPNTHYEEIVLPAENQEDNRYDER